jgi:hypothetical protein
VPDIDVDDLPPTHYLIMDCLAARYRCGEQWWTFPNRLKPQIRTLEAAGLVTDLGSASEGCTRVALTSAGEDAVLSPTHQTPVPTLAQALDTLPSTNDDYLAWMRAHGLGHGAGIGNVISWIRHDLTQLLKGQP